MFKLALLTYDGLPDLYPSDQTLIPLLNDYGIIAKPAIWNDKLISWLNFDGVLFRNTWDYYKYPNEFLTFLSLLDNLNLKSINPTSIIRKNVHKFYLKEIEESGVDIVPSIFIEKNKLPNAMNLLKEDWNSFIIKPAISAGSWWTRRFDHLEIKNILLTYETFNQKNDLIIQKFIPEIQTIGEYSLVFIKQKFSHAILKRPKEGDFRIQVQFGGRYEKINPEKSMLDLAQSIVDRFAIGTLYSRVDGVFSGDHFLLMELEMIEPDLYFDHYLEGKHLFVESIANTMLK